MSAQNSTYLTLEKADKILKDFSCIETKPVTAAEKASIREALLLITNFSDYQILGICADTTEQGVLALKTYSEALGYEAKLNLTPVEGAVYLKFNSKTGLCYLNSYLGKHRGVLVSCQSPQYGSINEMYGHLPLDLFES